MASNLLILAGLAGLAAFVGHFFDFWGVVAAVSVVLVACGFIDARRG